MKGAASVVFPAGGVDPTWKVAGFGDFNCDGNADVVWRNPSTGDNGLFLMNGASPTIVLLPSVKDPAWKIEAVADFEGNGHAGIMWRNAASGASKVWLMDYSVG